jgi:predicted methyltransferase
MRSTLFVSLVALALASCTTVPAEAPLPTSVGYAAALATRSEADLARDEVRKPAEVLAFMQVRPGETVGDYIMGSGYFTRVLAAAVGPSGTVYAVTPDEFVAMRAAYGDEQNATVSALFNAVAVRGPAGAPAFPAQLDAIVTIQNFHDLYLTRMPAGSAARAVAALYAALKPGGRLVVIDHSAASGSGADAPNKLHRIDQANVAKALTDAGFQLEAESAIFANPADPRDKLVFDPSIRGRTDQFMLRFRKPR